MLSIGNVLSGTARGHMGDGKVALRSWITKKLWGILNSTCRTWPNAEPDPFFVITEEFSTLLRASLFVGQKQSAPPAPPGFGPKLGDPYRGRCSRGGGDRHLIFSTRGCPPFFTLHRGSTPLRPDMGRL